MTGSREDIRNIAIIAHVDHGKTTLVDALLRQSGIFREGQEVVERVLDSNDIERERGITILSKNTAITYRGVKINIVDTPGHADFGGEVERVLKMVDGVVLLVDAFEGPMPQTRFVLGRAMELDLSCVVCVNKIDRDGARPAEVVDEVLELLMELGASDEQIDCPFVFCSARDGSSSLSIDQAGEDLRPLLDTIIDYIPAPEGDKDQPLAMLISTIDYSEYLGSIGIGKISDGTIHVGDQVVLANHHDRDKLIRTRIARLYEFDGLTRKEVREASFGDIVAVSGIEEIAIGDTLCSPERVEPIAFQKISEPTIAMYFMVNDSPLAGTEGKYVTSRHIRERLMRELHTDVSLRVEDTDSTDCMKVSGRGELHLSVLIENMRREGYEFAVSKAEVIYRHDEEGRLLEPMETVTIDVPDEYTGVIIEDLSGRKGELTSMSQGQSGTTRLIFLIPSRGLIGYRQDFLTDTKGTGVMNTAFEGYGEYRGDLSYRGTGSIISCEDGEAVAYGLYNAQERGVLFIGPGERVYNGMVVGSSPKTEDVDINVCRQKKLTNTRAAGADEALRLTPPRVMSLEQCMDFIDTDELIEITPKSIRIRKKILDPLLRKRAAFKAKQGAQ